MSTDADMKSNTNEIMQNLGRLQSMCFCAASSAGLLDPATVAAILIMIATGACNMECTYVSHTVSSPDPHPSSLAERSKSMSSECALPTF